MALPNGELQLTPLNPQHAYPVDRRMQIDTINSRDTISPFIRWRGMQVHVLEDDTTYMLKGGLGNEYWTVLGSGGGTGGTNFVGQFSTYNLLPTTGSSGDYAYVGEGDDFVTYYWDNISGSWIPQNTNFSSKNFYHAKTIINGIRENMLAIKTDKDIVYTDGGIQIIYPEFMGNYIFTGQGVDLRGVGYADDGKELTITNSSGENMIISNTGTIANTQFLNTLILADRQTAAFKSENGKWVQSDNLAPVGFSDALNSVHAIRSIGPDGLEVISNIQDRNTLSPLSFKEITTFADGTVMDDSKLDGFFHIKDNGKYFVDTKFQEDRIINVKRLGAKGGDFDNKDVFSILESICAKLTNTCTVFFPRVSGGYYTTEPVSIPHGIDVIMDSQISYDGSPNFPALTLGTPGINSTNRIFKIRVGNVSLSDWENTNNIGVKILNCYSSTSIEIIAANRFTEGVWLVGDGSGFVYNKVFFGSIQDNQIGVRLESINGGWVNENILFGGRFAVFSNTNITKPRYGIVIGSKDGSYINNNNNNFYEPSFEMRQPSSEIECVPVVVHHGTNNAIFSARSESNGSILAQTFNESQNNLFDFGYSPSAYAVHDLGIYPSSRIRSRGRWIDNPDLGFDVYNSKNVSKRACEYNSTNVYAEDELFFAVSSTSLVYKFQSSITRANQYLSISSSRAFGVRIDSSHNKRFVVIKNHHTDSPSAGRILIRCYDASGNVLSGTAPYYVRGTSGSLPNPYSSFGGSYRQGNDTSGPLYFVVDQLVAYIDVLFQGGSSGFLYLTDFTIKALDRPCGIINPFSKKGLYASVKPSGSEYDINTIIYNDNQINNKIIGWVHNGAGVWDYFGAVGNIGKKAELINEPYDLDTLTNGFEKYNIAVNPFINSPDDLKTWVIQDIKGDSHEVHIQKATDRSNGDMYIRTYISSAWTSWVKINGPKNFLDLPDTPSSYTGAGGQTIKVNGSANATEFINDTLITGGSEYVSSGGTADTITLSANYGLVTVTGTGGSVGGVTGLANKEIIIVNESSGSVTLIHEHASATATNRFSLPGSVDLVIPSNSYVRLLYINSRYRQGI